MIQLGYVYLAALVQDAVEELLERVSSAVPESVIAVIEFQIQSVSRKMQPVR